MSEEEITPEEFARIQEEEFGVSPEERARIDAKMSATLAEIRAGHEPKEGYADAIHNFGEEQFREALPEIINALTSSDERQRYMALHVLAFHFRLKEYKYAAMDMLLHDPDEDCRQQAAAGLGSLMKNTGDYEALHVLAQVIHNDHETDLIRSVAYRAMHTIVHYDRNQQKQFTVTLFTPDFQIDWAFVDTYL